VKRYSPAVIAKYRMPFGNHGAAMAWSRAEHGISLASHANTAKLHGRRARQNGASSGCLVTHANNAFH
jgi:hypothetical protein